MSVPIVAWVWAPHQSAGPGDDDGRDLVLQDQVADLGPLPWVRVTSWPAATSVVHAHRVLDRAALIVRRRVPVGGRHRVAPERDQYSFTQLIHPTRSPGSSLHSFTHTGDVNGLPGPAHGHSLPKARLFFDRTRRSEARYPAFPSALPSRGRRDLALPEASRVIYEHLFRC